MLRDIDRVSCLLGESVQKPSGDLSDASAVFDNAARKASSDLDTTKNKVKSDVSGTKGTADSFVADAQSKVESASKDGKGIVGDLLDKIQDAVPQ